MRPLSSGIKDTVGGFATTIDPAMEEEFSHDDYQSLLIKTLGERLAEAAAEKIHETLRKEVWGYAKDEKLTMKQLLKRKRWSCRHLHCWTLQGICRLR